jgi:hypothetical protein
LWIGIAMIGMVKGKGSRGWAEAEIYLKPGSAEGREKRSMCVRECVCRSRRRNKSSMGNGWTGACVCVCGVWGKEAGGGPWEQKGREGRWQMGRRAGRLRTTRTYLVFTTVLSYCVYCTLDHTHTHFLTQ